jgi:short subunit dehydrogenase-like uncharacterized protein
MIDRFHRRAEQTGARIVHCAGFDSIPSDLGVFMLAEEMERRHGRKLGRVRCRVGPVRGGFSAGTLASIAGVLGAMKRPELRRVFADPYALNPEGAPRGPDENERLAPEKDEETGRWTAPFIMSSVNTRIVRRSNALLGQKYGESFSYQEAMNTGRGAGGLALAAAISAGVSTVSVAAVTLPDSWIERLLPKSGEGPSAEKQARGFFRLKLFAEGLTGTVEGKGDPGYSQTAKMLAETALCLALDPAAAKGGILTPAAAMGQALLERLRRAGMGFSVAVSGSAG